MSFADKTKMVHIDPMTFRSLCAGKGPELEPPNRVRAYAWAAASIALVATLGIVFKLAR